MIVDSFVKERKNGVRLEKGLKLQVAQAMLQQVLKKIKEKHTHLDKNEPDEEMNREMKFGTNHEIDSVATLTRKFSRFLTMIFNISTKGA